MAYKMKGSAFYGKNLKANSDSPAKGLLDTLKSGVSNIATGKGALGFLNPAAKAARLIPGAGNKMDDLAGKITGM
tara:strand:- start:389 stop:613 length:225 start_codon:yes stop_codon:yes gene_type:complete